MALNEQDPTSQSAMRGRMSGLRWVLAAIALVLGIIVLNSPDNWAIALTGFLFVSVVAIATPRKANRRQLSDSLPQRNNVWPGVEMKSLCEALAFPAYIIDRGGALRYCNQAATHAFGAAKIGDPISFKFRNPEIVRMIGDAIAAGEKRSMEYHDQIPPDRWFWLSVAPIPKAGAGNEHDFHILSFIDLSEAKRVEQMRSDFIANASHELRTPLASLRGFIETIKGPAASDPKASRQFLDLMLEQAERMARLVDDLLSLSRIELRAHVRPSETVELNELLKHVRDTFAPLAKKNGIELFLDIPDNQINVTGDRDQLIQVFENLVENACKYGQSGKRIDIVARMDREDRAARRVTVTVRDYGAGIAAEHLPRLTERFYRVDVESSREKQGTGLGLAIVKHILARHGTRLSISSQPGKGASFSVAFPLIRRDDPVEGSNKSDILQKYRLS